MTNFIVIDGNAQFKVGVNGASPPTIDPSQQPATQQPVTQQPATQQPVTQQPTPQPATPLINPTIDLSSSNSWFVQISVPRGLGTVSQVTLSYGTTTIVCSFGYQAGLNDVYVKGLTSAINQGTPVVVVVNTSNGNYQVTTNYLTWTGTVNTKLSVSTVLENEELDFEEF